MNDAARADIEAVELANTAFYEAMERGDFEEISDLWLDESRARSPASTPAGRCSPGVARYSARTR